MRRLTVLFIVSLFIGCNDELVVNAPWKDVAVIYGILDKTQDTNYVRIHRGYLGNEGFAGGNNEPDSLYYATPSVRIEVYQNESFVKSIDLTRDETIELDSGFFTTEDYHTYRIVEPLAENTNYKLVVDKSEDGLKDVYADAPMVDDFAITDPRAFRKLNFTPNGQKVTWDYAVNARLYQASMRMHYTEMNRANHNDTVQKFVDYLVTTRTGNNLNGSGSFTVIVDYDAFYRFLASSIEVNRDVIRFYRGIDLKVVAAEDDFATYMSVSAPATTVVQDKPHFTNIEGGDGANAGIFSTINSTTHFRMDLSNPSLDSLIFGALTCDLQFGVKNALDTCYCQNGIFPTCD